MVGQPSATQPCPVWLHRLWPWISFLASLRSKGLMSGDPRGYGVHAGCIAVQERARMSRKPCSPGTPGRCPNDTHVRTSLPLYLGHLSKKSWNLKFIETEFIIMVLGGKAQSHFGSNLSGFWNGLAIFYRILCYFTPFPTLS